MADSPTLPAGTQRGAVLAQAPPWLSTGQGKEYLGTLADASDSLISKMRQAMRAHIPGAGTDTALPYLATDYVMGQAPGEPNASFAARLARAFDSWQHAGSRAAVMAQALTFVQSFHAASATQVPRAVIVSTTGAGVYASWDTFYNTSDLASQDTAHKLAAPANWDWDGAHLPWRAWLVLFFEAGATLNAGDAWGSLSPWGSSDRSWGLNVPSETIAGVRALLRLWKGARSYYPWIVISFNGSDGGTGDEFSPNGTSGAGNPDPTWARWSKVVNGVRVAARSSTARYCDGTGIYQSCFVHTES